VRAQGLTMSDEPSPKRRGEPREPTARAGLAVAYNKSVTGSGACGAFTATLRLGTPRAGHGSRQALRVR